MLPGFVENAKIEVLKSLRDHLEVIICIYSGDIERKKMRGDSNITYDVVLEPIKTLKYDLTGNPNPALNAKEVLIALSISAAMNPIAEVALEKLKMLHGCQAHSTTMLNDEDERAFKEMGIDITSDPIFTSSNLFYDM